MLKFMQETLSVWELLQHTKKPIVLYGMGNGADKIIDWCEANGVQVQGVFASDEFVRGQQFRGFTVERYDVLRARLGNELLVVIALPAKDRRCWSALRSWLPSRRLWHRICRFLMRKKL